MSKISFLYKKILFNLKPKVNLDKLNLKKNTLEDLFNYFGSDKGSKVNNPYKNNANEEIGHGFGEFYEKHLEGLKEQKINLLEIGTWKGSSIASFYFYFKNANIFCIDRNYKFNFRSKRINFFNCNTQDERQMIKLLNFFKKKNCKSFDIIIDDGSHLLSDISKNFIFFFKLLKPNGYYIIEDYNHPKYYNYLNDLKPEEPFIDEVLNFMKKKEIFKSSLFSTAIQREISNDIEDIFKYKGGMFNEDTNISDIAFIKKKGNNN